MSSAILFRKTSGLCLRTRYLGPLTVLEDNLVAAGQDLKRLIYFILLVEFYRPGFAENFEVSGVNEVAHFYAADFESDLLDRIRALVRVHRFGVGARRHHIVRRIHEHLDQFVRRRHAY